MTDDELLALAQIGVGIAANEVAAMIERHRAEVEAIKRHLDEAEIAMPSGTPNWTLAERVKIACIAATDETDRAEVERLTRERDEARSWNKLYDREPNEARKKAIALRAAKWELGCCCQFDENDEQIIWCAPHADLKQRAEAAEAALAAAEERVREECARIADNWAAAHGQTNWIGAAIRARKP